MKQGGQTLGRPPFSVCDLPVAQLVQGDHISPQGRRGQGSGAIIPSVGVGWRALNQKAQDPPPLLALLGMNPLKGDQKDLSKHPTWWLLFEDLEPFLTTANITGNG